MFRIVRKKRNHDFPTSRKLNLNIENKNNPTSGLLKMKIDILFYHGDQQLNKCDPWNNFFSESLKIHLLSLFTHFKMSSPVESDHDGILSHCLLKM